MRSLQIFAIGVLILTTSAALAEGFRSPDDPSGDQPGEFSRPYPALTSLQISPMYQEIKEVLLEVSGREEVLLKELAAADDEAQCQRVIKKIEELDLQRDLKILHIQARYAHQAGRWNLEKQIRGRILELEENQVVAVK